MSGRLLLATNNRGKAKEFQTLFARFHYEVLTLQDVSDDFDVEETGDTFEENASLKAEAAANHFGMMTIADDSGLCIDALGGKPGVYSARYAGEEKSDESNIEKVLQELREVPDAERTALFVCCLAVAFPGFKARTVMGTVHGRILHEKRGANGFGYDPIFFFEEEGATFAELSSEQKQRWSHRANAMKKLETVLGSWMKEVESDEFSRSE
ncbi:XTP/dITP diphosphatase [Bacillus fonticola]|uniref:XTP/dITP diphosphatase n=1 Tax=Bacillus fonticola TaxID=2728853 RepID=UPI0014743300|nr:XTP/dITP diphosphatase [Bacillus fonticola]